MIRPGHDVVEVTGSRRPRVGSAVDVDERPLGSTPVHLNPHHPALVASLADPLVPVQGDDITGT